MKRVRYVCDKCGAEHKEGINLEVVRKSGDVEQGGVFAVQSINYIDMLFMLKDPVWLHDGDQLRLSFDVPVRSYEWETMTHKYKEAWTYMSEIAEGTVCITCFRFTKIRRDAWIELLEEEPAFDPPTSEKAVKIR